MFDRMFGKKKSEATPAAPGGPETSSHDGELAVTEPTIGLCFNFARGLAWDSESLSDLGLDLVLKSLAECELRGTFFCPAKLCETSAPILRRIADAGHEVGALGFADEAPGELTREAVAQLVISCRAAFRRIGLHPVGFRSPKSRWDEHLMAALPMQGFRYSAEHDHAHHPYWIDAGGQRIVRVPVRTDDRGLRRSGNTYDAVVSKHLRVLRKTLQRKCFATICFHPWILAESPEQMAHWQDWLSQALCGGAKVVALDELLPKGEDGK